MTKHEPLPGHTQRAICRLLATTEQSKAMLRLMARERAAVDPAAEAKVRQIVDFGIHQLDQHCIRLIDEVAR